MNNQSQQSETGISAAMRKANVSQRRINREVGIDRLALREWQRTGKEPKLKPWQVLKLLKILNCTLEDITDDTNEDGLMAA